MAAELTIQSTLAFRQSSSSKQSYQSLWEDKVQRLGELLEVPTANLGLLVECISTTVVRAVADKVRVVIIHYMQPKYS